MKLVLHVFINISKVVERTLPSAAMIGRRRPHGIFLLLSLRWGPSLYEVWALVHGSIYHPPRFISNIHSPLPVVFFIVQVSYDVTISADTCDKQADKSRRTVCFVTTREKLRRLWRLLYSFEYTARHIAMASYFLSECFQAKVTLSWRVWRMTNY